MTASLASSVVTHLRLSNAALSLAGKRFSFLSFAANEDNAEKGDSAPAIGLNRMQRAIKRKSHLPFGDKEEPEETAASTGISRCAGDGEKHGGEKTVSAEISTIESRRGTGSSSESPLHTPSTPTGKESGADLDATDYVDPGSEGSGYNLFINPSHHTYPHGTPRLAALQSSSKSLAIWRRFSRTHCRLLQRLQNQITALEQKLDILDEQDARSDLKYRLARNDWHEEWDREQEDLLEELQSKILIYDDLLLKDSQLRRLTPPPARDHRHLFNWIYGTKPLDAGHYDFVLHNYDFVSSSDVGKNSNGFDDFIESCLSCWPTSPLNYFLRRDKNPQSPHIHYFSRSRITLAAKLLALCIAVSILLVPIFLFLLLDLDRQMTSIIVLIFVLVFAIVISLFTGASVESIFIGTCTYAAVLVTFLGNVQPTAAVGKGS